MSTLLAGLRPGWIPFGWFVCAAISSVVLFGFIALGLVSGDPEGADPWVAAALVTGFFFGGLFVGTRVAAAPVLHGLAIGAFTLVVWLVANLLLGEPTDQTAWAGPGAVAVAALMVLHTTAAVVGARIGVRWVRQGR
jgi:hypothetical protein